MNLLSNLLGGGGVIDKVTGIADKLFVDKDKRNEMIYEISILMMQSKIAPYIRGVLGIVIVVGCMFFGDSITLDAETQKYAFYSVLGYYFLDRVFQGFNKKNKAGS